MLDAEAAGRAAQDEVTALLRQHGFLAEVRADNVQRLDLIDAT